MADADDKKKQEDSEEPKNVEKEAKNVEKEAKKDEKASRGGILQWVIMAVVAVICAGAGFGLGRLFAGTSTPKTTEPSQQDQPTLTEDPKADDSTTDSQEGWYYEVEPVVACLDEPGATRYVRATLRLKISYELNQKQGAALLDGKKPVLINWLAIYLASLRIEDIRGENNQKRIQLRILDAFNERLFPDAKPQIRKILFKEFVVQ
jgi:flagellar basal body-associated protein FliL